MTLDLKLGVRMLVKYPGLTVVAVVALAVAIGAGAAYLEFLNDLFHGRPPGEDGDRIVAVYNEDVARSEVDLRSLHDFATWREELESVEELGATRALQANLITGDGRSEPVRGVEISASAFRILRTPPLLGRVLVEEDERPGAPPVVLLGHDLWQARFGGDPGVVGRTVRLGRTLHTVVGVMPEGFGFPANHGLWTPLRLNPNAYARGEGPELRVFGRLAPGAGLEEAQAELTAIGRAAAADFPETHEQLRPRVTPWVQSFLRATQEDLLAMRILYSANLLFLGILGVCGANVATLVFARTATRGGELTVRTALGASRRRIVAQLFCEALVLASVAAAAGLAVAWWASRWAKNTITAAIGQPAPFWWDEGLSPQTLAYAVGLALLTALIVGVVPALKATGRRVQAGLKDAAVGGASLKFGRVWTGVIVSQVALTVLFLLIVASIGWNLHTGRYGAPAVAFPAEDYLEVRLEQDREPPAGEAAGDAEAAFGARYEAVYRRLEERLAAEPGVAGVTYGSGLPGRELPRIPLDIEGVPAPPDNDGAFFVETASIAADYFEMFDAPIVAGRGFTESEVELGRDVAIVDETFVRTLLGGRNPIGLRVRRAGIDRAAGIDREARGPWLEIVGVVRDLTAYPRKSSEDAVLYRPAPPRDIYPIRLAAHVSGDAGALAPRVRRIAAEVDPTVRLHDLRPMSETGRADRLAGGFFVRVLAILGAAAVLLATAGVYALMSFTAARRTREIGIRAALGADPRRIVTGIFSRAFAQVGLGVLAGSVPGSLLIGMGILELSRGAGPAVGLSAVLGVAAFMMGVTLLACVVPARRALRIQPTEALRGEG